MANAIEVARHDARGVREAARDTCGDGDPALNAGIYRGHAGLWYWQGYASEGDKGFATELEVAKDYCDYYGLNYDEA